MLLKFCTKDTPCCARYAQNRHGSFPLSPNALARWQRRRAARKNHPPLMPDHCQKPYPSTLAQNIAAPEAYSHGIALSGGQGIEQGHRFGAMPRFMPQRLAHKTDSNIIYVLLHVNRVLHKTAARSRTQGHTVPRGTWQKQRRTRHAAWSMCAVKYSRRVKRPRGISTGPFYARSRGEVIPAQKAISG